MASIFNFLKQPASAEQTKAALAIQQPPPNRPVGQSNHYQDSLSSEAAFPFLTVLEEDQRMGHQAVLQEFHNAPVDLQAPQPEKVTPLRRFGKPVITTEVPSQLKHQRPQTTPDYHQAVAQQAQSDSLAADDLYAWVLELKLQNQELLEDNAILARQVKTLLGERQQLATDLQWRNIDLGRYKPLFGNLFIRR